MNKDNHIFRLGKNSEEKIKMFGWGLEYSGGRHFEEEIKIRKMFKIEQRESHKGMSNSLIWHFAFVFCRAI